MTKKLDRDAFESLIIRVPIILFSFLHSIFLIRLLGPEGNGLYTFLMAGISLSIVVAGFDAKRSTLYHLAKAFFKKQQVLGYSLKVYTVSITLVTIFILGIFLLNNKFSYLFIPKEHFTLFYAFFFIASFGFQHLTELCQTILQAEKEFRSINKFLFYTSALQVILYGAGYLYAYKMDKSIPFIYVFSLILAMQGITFLTALYFTIRKYKSGISFETTEVRTPFLEYARLGYVNHLGHFLNKRLDVWFVEIYTGLKSLGFYGLASQLTNFLLLAAAPIEEVLKTYLITLEKSEGNAVFIRYFKLIFYFIILLAIILFLLAPWVIRILFGIEFIAAVTPLRILCIGIVCVNVKRVFLNYNRAYNELYYNIWAQWVGVAVTVILDIILIPIYGVTGAAWASVIAYGTSALILAWIFLSKEKVNILKLIIPTRSELKAFKFK